jgi:hypothetical protein
MTLVRMYVENVVPLVKLVSIGLIFAPHVDFPPID